MVPLFSLPISYSTGRTCNLGPDVGSCHFLPGLGALPLWLLDSRCPWISWLHLWLGSQSLTPYVPLTQAGLTASTSDCRNCHRGSKPPEACSPPLWNQSSPEGSRDRGDTRAFPWRARHLPPFFSPSSPAPHNEREHRCHSETALLVLFSCVLSTAKGQRARLSQRSFSEEGVTFLTRAVGAGAVESVGVGYCMGVGTGRRASPSSLPPFFCPFSLEAGAESRCPGLC